MADDSSTQATQVPFVDPKQAALWGIVNSIQQKFQLEGAYLKKMFPDGNFEPVPFGSTIVNVQAPQTTSTQNPVSSTQTPITPVSSPEVVKNANPQTTATPAQSSSSLNKLIQGLILGTGVVGGGLGLAAFLRPNNITQQPVVNTQPIPVITPDQKEQIIEGILEWEFDSDKGLNLKPNGDSNGVSPSTNREITTETNRIASKLE